MSSRLVHIARNGKILGQYPPEQLAPLLASGFFFESDFCYSEASPNWIPLSDFLKKTEIPKYSRTTESEDSKAAAGSGRSAWQDYQSARHDMPLIAGWIAFLLALSAVAGAGYWVVGLHGDLAQQRLRIQQVEKQLADKDKEYQRMLFLAREVAEPGLVRGSIVLRNDSGKRSSVPGIQIFLFLRKAVEEHLEARAREAALLPAGTNVDATEFFLTNFPKALASTTTDASGRYEFQIPEPGEYIVSTSISSTNQNGRFTRLWFVSFNSRDPLNTAVDITDTNGVQQFLPSLMIVEGR